MATFKVTTLSGAIHKQQDGIKIRICHYKTVNNIPTVYYIEDSFLEKSGLISSSYPNSDALNFELGDLIQKYRGVYIKPGTARLAMMNCSEVREQIIASMEPEYEFIDFIKYSNDIIKQTKKEKPSYTIREC